jgi:hypothetical protein
MDNSQLVTRNSQPATLNQLREKIRAVETENRRGDGSIVKHGCEAIDRLLPEGGYPRGSLVQWLSSGGLGAEYLSLRVAQQACQSGGALVIADPQRQFFPPAAAAMGLKLDNMILLQTENDKELWWGIDQALRCPAVAAVWGWLDVIEERQFRRFQLSAESSGAIGLFLQPYAAARKPSWAEVQWLVGMNSLPASYPPTTSSLELSPPDLGESLPIARERNDGLSEAEAPTSSVFQSTAQLLQASTLKPTTLRTVSLQLTRCRGTYTGKAIWLAIDPVTGSMEKIKAADFRLKKNAHSAGLSPLKMESPPTRKSIAKATG